MEISAVVIFLMDDEIQLCDREMLTCHYYYCCCSYLAMYVVRNFVTPQTILQGDLTIGKT